MQRDAFISHDSEDRDAAFRLCEALEHIGVTCWIAPRDVGSGNDFSAMIYQGLQECRALLLVLTRAVLDSEYVRSELHNAKSLGLKIIPVNLDNVKPSGGLAIEIGLRHHIKVNGPLTTAEVKRVAQDVKHELDKMGPPPGPIRRLVPPPPVNADEHEGTPLWVWLASGAVVIALALFILLGNHTAASTSTADAAAPKQEDAAQAGKETPPIPASDSSTSRPAHEDNASKPAAPPASEKKTARAAAADDEDETPRTVPKSTVVPPKELTNSLAMKFLPLPGLPVMMCVHETRRSDFEAFVQADKYDATADAYSVKRDGRDKRGDSWKSPGFVQSGDHPVVAVSWIDAMAFCSWLTNTELKSGKIKEPWQYRLPTDLEWSAALGITETPNETPQDRLQRASSDAFPWGKGFPPRGKLANLGGEDTADKDWPPLMETVDGYRDGFPRTAPVMSFPANALGFHDLSGNVGEWIKDRYNPIATLVTPEGRIPMRTVRGGDWTSSSERELLSTTRLAAPATMREVMTGFRIVLELDAAPQ